MSVKLDLTQFKHIKSDEHSSTLQHKDGHQLVLAHRALAPESQAQLKALSKISQQDQTNLQSDDAKHQSRQKMADGGNPSNNHYYGGDDKPAPTEQSKPTVSVGSDYHSGNGSPASSKPGPAQLTKPSTWYADGGKVAKYCQYCGDSVHQGQCDMKAEGGEIKPPVRPQPKPEGSTLNYPQLKKEYIEKNKRKHYADGDLVTKAEPGDHYNPSQSDPNSPDDIAQQMYTHPAPNLNTNEAPDDGHPKLPGESGYDNGKKSKFDQLTDWATRNEGQNQPIPQMPGMPAPQPPPIQSDVDANPAEPADTSETHADPSIGQASSAAPATPTQPRQAAPAQPQGQPAAPQGQPQTSSAGPKSYAEHYQDTKQDILQEDQHWQHDLNNGHITPKTYNDLMYHNSDGSEKSTLGKIGSIFSMIVAGAGSGLAHQPNAMLDMMNKTIENDIKGQETSKTNAQNYLKLNQADAANKAGIKLTGANTQMTREQAAMINLQAKAMTKIQMQRAALHDLVLQTQQLPQGSKARADAEQQLAMVSQGVQNDNYDLADKASAGVAYYKAMFGNQGQSQPGQTQAGDPEEQFRQHNNGLRMMGEQGSKKAEYNEAHHIPGYTQQSSGPVDEKTRDAVVDMNTLDAKGKDLLNFIKQNSGTLNPQQRAIAHQKVEEMKNFYNNSIRGGALTEGRLGWYDEQFKKNPTDILPQLMGNTKKMEEMINSNTTRRDQIINDKLGINPKSRYVHQEPQQQAQPQYKIFNGVKYMRGPNGEPIPVK